LKGDLTVESSQQATPGAEPRPEAKEPKPRRFQIIKLEERVAPGIRNPHYSYFHCK
jgi:hypothetical protein